MPAESCPVLIMGRHSTGKVSLISDFSGVNRDKVVGRVRWISQAKGTKDNITLQGLPEEHGRMSAYRQRIAAVNESKAYIIVVRNNEPVHFQYYYELIETNVTNGMGPFLVISGYITDEKPELNPKIAEWAKNNNARVELLNIEKIKNNDSQESQLWSSLIYSLVEKAQNPEPKVEEEKVEEAKEETTQQDTEVAPPPAKEAKIEKESEKEKKENENEKVVSVPNQSKLYRALSFLARGGSVA